MHLYGQPFGGVLENNSFTSSFFGKKCKNKETIFEAEWLLSKMFSQIKMQAATNWSSHLKNSFTLPVSMYKFKNQCFGIYQCFLDFFSRTVTSCKKKELLKNSLSYSR